MLTTNPFSDLVHTTETPKNGKAAGPIFDRPSTEVFLDGLGQTTKPTDAVKEHLATLPENSPVSPFRVSIALNIAEETVTRILHRIAAADPNQLDRRKDEDDGWLFRIPGKVHVRPITAQNQPPASQGQTGTKTGLVDLVRKFAHDHEPLEVFTQAAFRILFPEWDLRQVQRTFALLVRKKEMCIGRVGRYEYEYWRPAEVTVTAQQPALQQKEDAPPMKEPGVHMEQIVSKYLEDWPVWPEGEDRTVERVRQDLMALSGATETTVRENFRKYGTKLGKAQNLSERGQPGKYRRTAFKATISNIRVQAVRAPIIEQEPEPVPTGKERDTTSQSQAAITYAPDFLALPYGEWRRLPDEVEIAVDKFEQRDGSVIETKWIRWPKPE